MWAAGHRLESLFFSAVGEAELRYGAAILRTVQRRETLVWDIERMLGEAFEDRVLPFDSGAARCRAVRCRPTSLLEGIAKAPPPSAL
ncbi:MAG: hypothetical protein OXH69_14340 [Acidobacteria bacterium]|nr:hypothetical protein [Acidobacteriota bacterium]